MPLNLDQQTLPENLTLERIPHDKTGTLQAFDAADSLLIQHWYESILPQNKEQKETPYPLIINDAFGALTLSLAHCVSDSIVTLSDSTISQKALRLNVEKNQAEADVQIRPDIQKKLELKTLSSVDDLPDHHFNCVLMKLPKSSQYFEYQLAYLNHYLPANTPVIIGGMVKYMSKAFFDSANDSLNDVSTSLAVKKARLIFGKTQGNKTKPELYSPFKENTKHLKLYDCPNGFSRGKLDIGSRFLLDNFPNCSEKNAILDIGCGCGVLGLTAAKLNPQARVTLIDESHQAIAATQYNIEANFNEAEKARLLTIADHNMNSIESNSQDMVLCNPPFHQGNTVGTQVAMQMFRDAKRVLTPQGELVIIANRHLNYHQVLKKQFKQVKITASNKKFVVIICRF